MNNKDEDYFQNVNSFSSETTETSKYRATFSDKIYVKFKKYSENILNRIFLIRPLVIVVLIVIYNFLAFSVWMRQGDMIPNTPGYDRLDVIFEIEINFQCAFAWIFGLGTLSYIILKMLRKLNEKMYFNKKKEGLANVKKLNRIYKINNVLAFILTIFIEGTLLKILLPMMYETRGVNIVFVISILAVLVDLLVFIFKDTKYDKKHSDLVLLTTGFVVFFSLLLVHSPMYIEDYAEAFIHDWFWNVCYETQDIVESYAAENSMYEMVYSFPQNLGFKIVELSSIFNKIVISIIVVRLFFKKLLKEKVTGKSRKMKKVALQIIKVILFLFIIKILFIINIQILELPVLVGAILNIVLTIAFIVATLKNKEKSYSKTIILISLVAMTILIAMYVLTGDYFIYSGMRRGHLSDSEKIHLEESPFITLEALNGKSEDKEFDQNKPSNNSHVKDNYYNNDKDKDKNKSNEFNKVGNTVKGFLKSNVSEAICIIIGGICFYKYYKTSKLNKEHYGKGMKEEIINQEKFCLKTGIACLFLLGMIEMLKILVLMKH